jgi:hypothetical protein
VDPGWTLIGVAILSWAITAWIDENVDTKHDLDPWLWVIYCGVCAVLVTITVLIFA